MTLDVRLLVRTGHDVDQALYQLLTGVLRVHAVVPLTTLPSGLTVPTPPVLRLDRSTSHYAVVRDWDGGPLP